MSACSNISSHCPSDSALLIVCEPWQPLPCSLFLYARNGSSFDITSRPLSVSRLSPFLARRPAESEARPEVLFARGLAFGTLPKSSSAIMCASNCKSVVRVWSRPKYCAAFSREAGLHLTILLSIHSRSRNFIGSLRPAYTTKLEAARGSRSYGSSASRGHPSHASNNRGNVLIPPRQRRRLLGSVDFDYKYQQRRPCGR